MRTHASFPIALWADTYRPLAAMHIHAYNYMRTCAAGNMLGLYYLPLILLTEEAKLTPKEISAALAVLEQHHLAYYDDPTRVVYLPQYLLQELKLTKTQPNVKPLDCRILGVQKAYEACPASPLCSLFFNHYSPIMPLQPRPDHDPTIISFSSTNTGMRSKKSVQPIPKPTKPEQPEEANEIPMLLARYSPQQQEVIQRCLANLATTRRNGKLSESVIIRILKQWDTIEVDRVLYGLEIFIDRGFHLENKKEQYLWAIMSRATPAQITQSHRRNQSRNAVNTATTTAKNLELIARLREGRNANVD